MPVYLVRHGQSEFNAVHDGTNDPMLFDARLTALGVDQARAARAKVAELGIRHVLTSPLTRAIQTTREIFGGKVPVSVSAGHREQVQNSCDVGRSPRELAAEFPDLEFGHLNEIWWHQGPLNPAGIPIEPEDVLEARIRAFAAGLDQFSDRPLAIVGHATAFFALSGRKMQNCEVHRLM
jgi:broad specificity phosphatase PhoE